MNIYSEHASGLLNYQDISLKSPGGFKNLVQIDSADKKGLGISDLICLTNSKDRCNTPL